MRIRPQVDVAAQLSAMKAQHGSQVWQVTVLGVCVCVSLSPARGFFN